MPVFDLYREFSPDEFLGKTEDQLITIVDEMFGCIRGSKPAYFGTLKGMGTGKSTLCAMLRFVCWKTISCL
jgi:hypothetical protein